VEAAEDILQEVFYQFTKTDEGDDPVEQVGAWLYRVARNYISNWYSKKKDVPLSSLLPLDAEDEMLASLADVLFSTDDTPESACSLVLSEIEDALAELPADQREIFEQTEFWGLAVKEIARVTGATLNTLFSRKHYAVVKLRKRLKDLYDDMVNGGLNHFK
jgi:RNA polymerase sigma factor (sigma-70 family)